MLLFEQLNDSRCYYQRREILLSLDYLFEHWDMISNIAETLFYLYTDKWFQVLHFIRNNYIQSYSFTFS